VTEYRIQHPHGIRLAICLSQGCIVVSIPLWQSSLTRVWQPLVLANSLAVAVDACFIYCFFNPFLVDLLSMSFLVFCVLHFVLPIHQLTAMIAPRPQSPQSPSAPNGWIQWPSNWLSDWRDCNYC